MPHSSAEAGERPSGPCGAKGVPRCGRGVGTTPRTLSVTSVHLRNDPVVCGTAIPQCDEPDASSTGTSGSVGAWVDDHPGLPGPAFSFPTPIVHKAFRYKIPATSMAASVCTMSALECFTLGLHTPGEPP